MVNFSASNRSVVGRLPGGVGDMLTLLTGDTLQWVVYVAMQYYAVLPLDSRK